MIQHFLANTGKSYKFYLTFAIKLNSKKERQLLTNTTIVGRAIIICKAMKLDMFTNPPCQIVFSFFTESLVHEIPMQKGKQDHLKKFVFKNINYYSDYLQKTGFEQFFATPYLENALNSLFLHFSSKILKSNFSKISQKNKVSRAF